MTVECISSMTGWRKKEWADFLCRMGLIPDENVESTVLLWDNEVIVAAGSRHKNVLKCIAVDSAYQGEGLTATLLTQLRQDAFTAGYKHLFLYTKPQNEVMFSSLFFYPVAKTQNVLLMESEKNGIANFLSGLPVPCRSGKIGAAVMHCNPFTRGHRYLIETAAKQCDWLYLFILSEEESIFPAADRMELVQLGTADLKNVTVYPTGQYLISSATFPSYFLKDRGLVDKAHCELDISVFLQHFVPHFSISHRFVGTEPQCAVTGHYNEMLKTILPGNGVDVVEIPRLELADAPISASTVRKLLSQENWEEIEKLVPETTLHYLRQTAK